MKTPDRTRRRRRAVAAAPRRAGPGAYPDKTITIVVPTAAGGGNDAMARTIAQKLGPLLGQTDHHRQPGRRERRRSRASSSPAPRRTATR